MARAIGFWFCLLLLLSFGHLGRIRKAGGSRHRLDHGIALRRPHRLSRETTSDIEDGIEDRTFCAPMLGIVLLVFELWACAH